MDAQTCRRHVARLLDEEIRLLGTLEQQLLREYQLLESNDVEHLEKASRDRQQAVADLLRVDDERRGLGRMLGHGADNTGLAALLRWCDPEGSLAAQQAACAVQAQRCRDQNDRNGALVTARLKRVNGMLGMLGAQGGPATYDGSRAARPASPAPVAGRMVSVSA